MASIIVIESNPVERDVLVDALHRRFGADFAVVALPLPDLPEEALASHAPIAVALAPIGTSDFALLDGLGAHHPGTRRIAVVRVGDTSVAQALGRALTLTLLTAPAKHLHALNGAGERPPPKYASSRCSL